MKAPDLGFPLPAAGSNLSRREIYPSMLGATGPTMLRLAGQYADGVVFNYPCTPSFIKYAMLFLQEGLKLSGRTLDNFSVAAYLLVSVDEDEKKALALPPNASLRRSCRRGIQKCSATPA